MIDAPPGLYVTRLSPHSPAGLAGADWWTVWARHAPVSALLRCDTEKATRAALDVLACVDWVQPEGSDWMDASDAVAEAATLQGVRLGWERFTVKHETSKGET